MNRKELIALHQNLCSRACELMAKKNHDYSGVQDTEDAFQNFRFIEATGATTAEVGIFTRICDKVKRLGGVVARGNHLQVSDESFEDTILDLINYAVILHGYRLSKSKEVKTSGAYLNAMNEDGMLCQCTSPVPGSWNGDKQARICASCHKVIPVP